MKNWREETQPELPQLALDARDVPLAGGDRPESASQGADGLGPSGTVAMSAVAEAGEAAGASGPAGASAPGGASGPGGAAEVTGATEVLPVGAVRDPWGAVLVDPIRGVPAGARRPHPFPARNPDRAPHPDDVGQVRIRPTGAPEVSDAPVFVDESGRRSRRFRRIGTAVGLACAVYAVVIVVTLLSGSSDAPWLPVPGQNHDRPAGRVDGPPRPARSSDSSGDDGPVAGPAVSGDGATPSARSSSGTPGARTADGGPSASASARPTSSVRATGAPPEPGSSSGAPSPSVSAPVSESPPPPASSPPASPSESAAPTGSGPVAEHAARRGGTRAPVL
ncbi:hypothetical protein [Streptomyces sp. NPDC001068]|uniref:hypothetical protein n=1 Tax=Streptomyces sp. NPDC001068 TaxID=3364544 RepID=UPI0036B4444D